MSSKFISESEIEEARRKRQEEWDRVRQPDQPKEAPEEPRDNRSLFERLQEQKQKKDLEYEEAHKLKNMIKGLDDDEIEFLDLVDESKMKAERRKIMEEEKELAEYRARVATLQDEAIKQRMSNEIAPVPKVSNSNKSGQKNSQLQLLKNVVVPRKRKGSEGDGVIPQKSRISTELGKETDSSSSATSSTAETAAESASGAAKSALKCIAILPGLGCYNSSSDSDLSDSDGESNKKEQQRDILGRVIKKRDKSSDEE